MGMRSMEDTDVFDLEIRRHIYDFISDHPSLHMREISRRLAVPKTTLRYHLKYLEKRGLVKRKPEGRCVRYYIKFKIGSREKKILSILRKDTSRNIVLYLLFHVYSSQIDLSGSLEKHTSTIEFHLKKLLELDIIKPVKVNDGKIINEADSKVIDSKLISLYLLHKPVGNEIIYVLRDPSYIYDVIKSHEDCLLNDDLSKELFYYFEYVLSVMSDGDPEGFNGRKNAIESALEEFYKICPHPYHV